MSPDILFVFFGIGLGYAIANMRKTGQHYYWGMIFAMACIDLWAWIPRAY